MKKCTAMLLCLLFTAVLLSPVQGVASGGEDMDALIAAYAKNAALSDWAQTQAGEAQAAALDALLRDVLQDKLGILDDAVKSRVLSSLIQDKEWNEMAAGLARGDYGIDDQNLLVLVGKVIVETVPESMLSASLGQIGGDGGKFMKAAEAAGYLAEGQYTEAARIIGTELANSTLVGKAFDAARKAVQYGVDVWREDTIDDAYEAFKNGEEGGFFSGKSIDAGHFDSVWEQYGSLARQLELEAIKTHNQALAQAGMPPLTAEEEARLRALVKQDMEAKFKARAAQEDAIAQTEQAYTTILEMYKDKGFLEKGRFSFDDHTTAEMRIEQLMHLSGTLLNDTGFKGYADGLYTTDESLLPIGMLEKAAYAWFNSGNKTDKERRAAYEAFLKEHFPQLFAVTAEELAGTYTGGTLVFTSYYFSEEMNQLFAAVKQAKDDGSYKNIEEENGCDFSASEEQLNAFIAQFDQSVGAVLTGDFAITALSDMAVTLRQDAQGSDTDFEIHRQDTLAFDMQTGRLTGSGMDTSDPDNPAAFTYDLTAARDGNTVAIGGTMRQDSLLTEENAGGMAMLLSTFGITAMPAVNSPFIAVIFTLDAVKD